MSCLVGSAPPHDRQRGAFWVGMGWGVFLCRRVLRAAQYLLV